MSRFVVFLTMALTGIATMYAGSLGINPGNVLNPDGTVSIGLLPSNPTTGTGLVSNPDGITGTNFSQRNYFNTGTILNGAQVTPGLPGSSSACSSNCQQTIYSPASAPEFNLLGDNILADKAVNSNAWYSLSNGANTQSTITIPVGIFGVNTIATMLNTGGGVTSGGAVGGNSAAYASITFQFNATDATGATGTNFTETFALINGVTQRNVLDGLGGLYASATSGSYTATDMGTNAGNTYTVTTGNEWTGNVTTAGTGNAPPVNTTMVLDYQVFPVLNAFRSDYLVSVAITDTGAASGASFSREILSGITVTTPEPSTILMLLGGFGAIGLSRLRRKRS